VEASKGRKSLTTCENTKYGVAVKSFQPFRRGAGVVKIIQKYFACSITPTPALQGCDKTIYAK
jgi:hypothetical protein